MDLDYQTRCVTRADLVKWSAFTLPRKAVKRLPKKDREGARIVPGLTLEMVRTCERLGLFDAFCPKHSALRGAWLLWKPRRRGETRLYTVLDVATARLVAWMKRDGFTNREIAIILRGRSESKALIASEAADRLIVSRWRGQLGVACILPKNERWAKPSPGEERFEFPLAWLGMRSSVLPMIQKQRSIAPAVFMWNRWLEPTAVMASYEARM